MNLSILFGLAAGTLVSEDLSSISAGLLSRDGVIGLVPAIVASMAGIYIGDLGLWALGYACGKRILHWDWIARRIDPVAVDTLGARLDGHMGVAVLGSRFLPGSRLPLYLALGTAGHRPLAFAAWSLLAVMLWAPVLVGLTYVFGSTWSSSLVAELNQATQYLITAMLFYAGWRLTLRIAANRLAPRS